MKCDWCGKPATIKDTDPYLDEIFPEDENEEESWWCEDCYQEQLDNI